VAPISPGWEFVHIGFEGDVLQIGGLNPWTVEWGQSVGRITVAHPQHPGQRHSLDIYRVVDSSGRPVMFAAGEFSNGVWGFFRPV
jgi:hypothetical protein